MKCESYSTTEGRQKLPDICMDVYGTKKVVGINRRGRTLCALVPYESIMMLSGQGDHLDASTRKVIMSSARNLLKQITSA